MRYEDQIFDEHKPFALVEFLRNKGYSASHLKQLGKGGIRKQENKGAWEPEKLGFLIPTIFRYITLLGHF
jgi:hypothetical protein